MNRRDLFQHNAFDSININPLLDLAWTLLIVFIMAITVSIQGISVNLPKASASPIKQERTTKAITVTREGIVYVDTYPVTIDQLEGYLAQVKATQGAFPVILKGDDDAAYGMVVRVLALLNYLDITQIALQTDAPRP